MGDGVPPASAFLGVSVAEMHPRLMMALFLPVLLFEAQGYLYFRGGGLVEGKGQ